MASFVVKVGPWGGAGGQGWSFVTDGGTITRIYILVDGDIITYLAFDYEDKSGKSCRAEAFGGSTTSVTEIDFAKGEVLSAISGTFDEQGITSLTFRTNKKVYSFGVEKGTKFSLPLDHGAFEGFYGTIDNNYVIRSIGAILRP